MVSAATAAITRHFLAQANKLLPHNVPHKRPPQAESAHLRIVVAKIAANIKYFFKVTSVYFPIYCSLNVKIKSFCFERIKNLEVSVLPFASHSARP